MAVNWKGKGAGKGGPQAPQTQQAGQKRPSSGAMPAGGKAARPDEKEVMIVYCTTEKDEIGIRTLVGEYREEGANHGRKFYKKTQKIPGHEDINVYLYFWDERDGASFSGWWFGNQVGGAQVWSRNAQSSVRPPRSGWTIPWDGEVKKELVVAPAVDQTAKQAQSKVDAKQKLETRRREEESKQDETVAADWEERFEKATLKAAEVEVGVTEALEAAKEAMDLEVDESVVQEAQRELASQATVLAETQRNVAMECLAAQKAPPQIKAQMQALQQRMRQLQTTVKEELQKMKSGTAQKAKKIEDEERRVEDESRERELEEGYAKQLEAMLPPAMEKTDAAEDEVEKVAIAAAPLQIDTSDELRAVMMQAIKETEQRVRAAQASIGEARRFISGKLSQVGKFAPNAKKSAVEEFTALQDRLKEAQNKLDPFKNVRSDYEQRAQAKKLHEELSGKVSGAEIEVEKAAMMTAPLGGESVEGMKETESALAAAQAALSQTTRLMDSKLRTGAKDGPMHEEIKALRDRARTAQEKLDEVRRTIKETQVRVAADSLLREVSEKVSRTEDELQKMAEAELPFLRGGEQADLDMDALLGEADKVAVKAHSAIAEAQTFVARKLVEVARFSEGPAKAVKGEIDMLQKRLEDGRERLQQFRIAMGERKRAHLLEEVDGHVKSAEEELQRMTEATKALESIGGAGEASGEGGQEAVEQATVAERAAQSSLVVARKSLLQRTADLKKLAITGAGAGSELGRLQTRVNHVQQEIAKLRSLTKDAEERLRVKQMMSEVSSRLETAEADVEKVSAAAAAEEQPSPDQVERVEKAGGTASVKLSATAKLIDVKLKNAQGFLKEELQAMREKITAAEKKLASVMKSTAEQRDQLRCTEIIAEAGNHVKSAQAELEKTGEAELPFLKGIEVLVAADSQHAVKACETAAAAAHKALTDARTFVVQKMVEVRELSKVPADACIKELSSLQKRLDEGAAKVAEFKKETLERKRTTQMQASGEKIANVEAGVQKLVAAMAKFPEDKIGDLSEDQARAACEEIADTENAAKRAVADARKFLAARGLDAKGSADLTASLAKLQARLTQCQVELAKLSKQCDEREQRFVAQKLVQDATKNMDQLRRDVEYASTLAQELLAEDRTELLTFTYLQAAVGALRSHVISTGTSAEALFKVVAEKAATASKEKMTKWLLNLADLTNSDEACFTEERAATVAAKIAATEGPGGGKTDVKAFKALLRERYVCTAATGAYNAGDGGAEVCRIEVGEGLELLETIAGSRAHCALSRSGAKVWVPLECVKESPAGVGRLESIEAYVKAVHSRCSEAASAADQKTVELSHVKQGPLVDVKTKLQEIRTLLGQERTKVDSLKKKALAAKAVVVQQRGKEVQDMQESRCKTFASKCVSEGTTAVEAAEKRATKFLEDSKGGAAEKLVKEVSAKDLNDLRSAAEEALKSISEAKAVVKRGQEAHENYKGAGRSSLLESRVELTKLASRTSTSERKLRAAAEAVRKAHTQVVKKASMAARAALREAARKTGKSVDELFDTLAKNKTEISEAEFLKFAKKLKGHSLTDEQVSLVYREFGAHGLKRPGFAKALQEFMICEKVTPITNAFDAASTTVRNLEKGETFEVLEGSKEEGSTKRVRGRALRDNTAGWVTLKAGEAPPLLKTREKPFMCVSQASTMRQQSNSDSPLVRELNKDEVLELLDGPKVQESASELALNARASKDGATGWVTLRDAAGNSGASASKSTYVCKSTIAMTDKFDLKTCKVLRKVEVGEALEVIGKQEADSEKGFSRVQFKALRDGKQGWITVKGNQGTVYLQVSDSHFVVDRKIALRSGAARDAEVLRMLEVGEALEGQAPPKEVKPEVRMEARARALEDDRVGWVIFPTGPRAPVRPWKKTYVCRVPVDLTPELKLPAENVTSARKTEVGVYYLVVDGPAVDPSGVRRVHLASAEEGSLGWATLRGPDGKAFLENESAQ